MSTGTTNRGCLVSNAVTQSGIAPLAQTDVVERARTMVPTLRARHAETDLLAKASEATAAELEQAGLFSLTVPRLYGGLQVNMTTWMQAISQLGRGDGGVAWAATLVNACNWMAAGLYPKHVADEVFDKPNARVAGVFSARGVKAQRAAGGIIVEKGMWFFNSGVYHAQWDLLGVPMFNEAGEPVGPGVALVPMRDVKILNDWDTIGLRGSGSSNVSMENVFIPDERIVSLAACNEGQVVGQFPNEASYHTAFAPLMVSILSFPVLGSGMHMIEEFVETLPKRDIKLTPYTKQAEAAVTQVLVGEASARIDAAKSVIASACSKMDFWAEKCEIMPFLDRARICRDTAFADHLVWSAVDAIGSASGGSFSRRGNVLSRIWGDVKVAGMHPFVSVTSNYENYGRIACGLKELMPC
jgi:3-hydroxy-9,10-secoandrosta-1,3,5(10)-triene-9,17-dione monooxygenase